MNISGGDLDGSEINPKNDAYFYKKIDDEL